MFNPWFWSGVGATGLVLFFALTHHALSRFSRTRLEVILHRRHRLNELPRLFQHHDELIRTIGLLYVLSMVLLAAVLMAWSHSRFGSGLAGWAVGIGLAAILGVTLGGVVPMAWARYGSESVLAAILPLCQACRVLFSPVRRVLDLADGAVRRLVGAPEGYRARSHMEEELRRIAADVEHKGVLAEDQKLMIENVIRFTTSDVGQIMTPRTDIVGIEAGASAEEAGRLVAQYGHSRIPVTGGNIDTIVGILYAKDLLERLGEEQAAAIRIREVMRAPLFVPETKKLDELLRDFQRDKIHLAIVLDEYGGTAGLVTIEDILEEIVGEIADEHEPAPPPPIRRLDDGAFEVDARVRVDELNEALSLDLPENEDYETIGGFVLSRLGYIPKAGAVLEDERLRITVLEAESRRITRLRIEAEKPPEAP